MKMLQKHRQEYCAILLTILCTIAIVSRFPVEEVAAQFPPHQAEITRGQQAATSRCQGALFAG